jgi:biopolymer transport protein ExbD
MKLESHLPKESPWLYITPLLNIVLLLLIYFLFSSGFVVQSGITIEKPRSNGRLAGFDHAHTLTLTSGSPTTLYLDGERISLAALRDALKARRAKERHLLLHADRQARTQEFTEISNLALELGFEVALATLPSTAEAAKAAPAGAPATAP